MDNAYETVDPTDGLIRKQRELDRAANVLKFNRTASMLGKSNVEHKSIIDAIEQLSDIGKVMRENLDENFVDLYEEFKDATKKYEIITDKFLESIKPDKWTECRDNVHLMVGKFRYLTKDFSKEELQKIAENFQQSLVELQEKLNEA